ncbi:DUF6492 family protein [Bradyrhizobium sp.]|uniref:DUF6492 family protein n=1 Tax=Bradyrhizobium sp. TaxID=376 RepID=UPI0025C55E12|nr:DUF6492 family protein [Bradyrhizobium sp.]
MAVMTKSYAPDFELCASLNRSVLDCSPDTVHHHIVVPRTDLQLFGRLAGPRVEVRCEADLLPRSFVRLPLVNIMVNLAQPFPPVRGWIQQQVIKLAAIAASQDDVVLVADSDVEFVRPFTPEMFVRNGNVRFFCKPDQIDTRLARHMTWHKVARELLGLPQAEPPYPDYISSPLAWDPKIVRQMLARVAATTKRPWPTAIAGQLDFSECVLYGIFVDEVVGASANSFVSDDSLCKVYWEQTPLTEDSAAAFIGSVRPTDIAVVIQSKSRTAPAVRDAVSGALSGRERMQGWRAGRA